MSRTLVKLAAAAAMLALVALGMPPAGAGRSSTVTITAACNTATGDYDVDYELFNSNVDPGDVTVQTYEVDGSAAAAPTFAPDPVPATSSSFASNSVPGTTTSIYIEVIIDYAVAGVVVENTETLDGDCVATTTTTTVTTTAPVANDVAATCDIIRQIDSLELDDPTAENADAVLAQLQRVIDLFEEAAAVAPPEVADDLQGFADGLKDVSAIVEQLAQQQGQPTPEQQQQLDALEQRIGPYAVAVEAWATANCATPAAAALTASPAFTG